MLESGMVSSSRHLLLQRYARLDLGSAQARWIFGGKLCKIWMLPCAKERFYDGRAHGLSVQNRTNLPDTLIPTKSMAEATGIDESTIRQTLKDRYNLAKDTPFDCVVRLKSATEAESLVAQLNTWANRR